MDSWDTDNFEPKPIADVDDRWEGEDEDDDLKDNWDEDSEEEAPKVEAPKPKEPPKKGGKKYLKEKLREKEEEERKKREQLIQEQMGKSAEDKMREQLLNQKLAEEADFQMMNEMLASVPVDPNAITLDSFKPRTKEDFTQFCDLLKKKLAEMESSPHYFYMMDTILASAAVPMKTEELKKLATSLNAIATEKLKQEKQSKKGKKSSKAKLGGATKSGRGEDLADYSQFNDYDDFM